MTQVGGAAQLARAELVVLYAFTLSIVAASPGAYATSDPAGEEAPRVGQPLTSGWRFKQLSASNGAESPQFDDSDWTRVTVPHTWNRLGNPGTERSPESNSFQGTGWYRLHFTAPAAAKGSRYFLQFDAVGTVAEVW